MKQTICVFCSSADLVDKIFFNTAETLARKLAENGFKLVYGGAKIGLMGCLARTAKENGVPVSGIIPQKIHDFGLGFEATDQYTITPDMRSRKQAMLEQSDAFIALPGGFGTLEEFTEVLTLKQLGYHQKPLILINVENFFGPLLEFFESLYHKSFAKSGYRQLYFVAENVSDAFAYLQSYQPPSPMQKWHKI